MFTPEMIVRVTLSTTSQHDTTRRDATTKRRADDLAVDTRDCDWLSKRDAMR